MAKKKAKYNQSSAIRSALRRSFSRSPVVTEVKMEGRRTSPRFKNDGTRHKVDTVEYQCEVCSGWVSGTEIAVDHIDPVVPPDGSFDPKDPNWNLYVARLWCPKENLQRICSTCHDLKTAREREARKAATQSLSSQTILPSN